MVFKFERLEVWQRSLTFADEMYKITDGLPRKYQLSIGEQLRRASLSVPTNIAEGTGRDSPSEAAYFYRISKGSLYECVSLLVLINRRKQIGQNQFNDHYHEADKLACMISGLIKAQKLNKQSTSQ